jgi:hypothetical protein
MRFGAFAFGLCPILRGRTLRKYLMPWAHGIYLFHETYIYLHEILLGAKLKDGGTDGPGWWSSICHKLFLFFYLLQGPTLIGFSLKKKTIGHSTK